MENFSDDVTDPDEVEICMIDHSSDLAELPSCDQPLLPEEVAQMKFGDIPYFFTSRENLNFFILAMKQL